MIMPIDGEIADNDPILKNYKYSQQYDRDGDNHEFHDTVKKTKKLNKKSIN